MSIKEDVLALREVALFSGVDDARLKLLAYTSQRENFSPGDVVFEQGDSAEHAYVILEGSAEIYIGTGDLEVVLARLSMHEILGEIAILTNAPRTASVRACEELLTLCISKDVFLQMLNDFPELSVAVLQVVASRLEKTNSQLHHWRNVAIAAGAR